MDPLEIFLATAPGLEPLLRDEAAAAGFAAPRSVPGGVVTTGSWAEVRRANLELRGATRVLARIAEFPAVHLAQLDKRARKVDWPALLRPEVPVSVEASCRKSKIYHDRAAAQRIARAITESTGAPVEAGAPIRIAARIEENLVTVSVDTSGAPLHRRGTKEFVGKAPLRETMAALFLRACGYDGTEQLVDPMCGSGTILLEAAGLAAGAQPGAARRFALDHLLVAPETGAPPELAEPPASPRILGYDRDKGAVAGATANIERAGLSAFAAVARQALSELERPEGPPGLVLTNPPYGARIGKPGPLHGLYATLGQVLTERFSGWRVGIVTSEPGLARATGLRFEETGPPIPHGPLKVRFHRTSPLP
ncbi:THUMP domain-containing class I SAM-dependent RNA methyltransferase [Histidinibacterium aquaticum]|uniref:Class I SAM-dependent RNA methyltransferase n=1 Tax=Histidinibacterium aquaticum TaxID=2613962 RepID=A0A5J5GR43_9RHOB|nr:THUMP domain-containing protein [Histidinibacterium aquaticum]KAA9009862.1 class I SAM-dependent RNA methyltransferase [Histidinibacterium aquaticum]